MHPLCSVLCVSYNHEKFSAAGLQSIYDQTYKNIEIIVLDDGSSDNSVEVIRSALVESPFPARFIQQENSGNVGANFNKVLGAASGEFVTMMSLDDMLMPDCIENAIKIMAQNKDIQFSANRGHININENNQRISAENYLPGLEYHCNTVQDLIELEYQFLGSFYVQGQVFRRDALMNIGGFDDTMTGDDIILRTRLFQYMVCHPELKFSLGNNIVISYRKHGNNLHRNLPRQIKTIVQWKEAYFPDRAYPERFYKWLEGFIHASIREDRLRDIQLISDLSPVVARFIQDYQKTWEYRRRIAKQKIRKLIKAQLLNSSI